MRDLSRIIHFLIRNRKTGDVVGINKCQECSFITITKDMRGEIISKSEYETYQELELFPQYKSPDDGILEIIFFGRAGYIFYPSIKI